MTKAQKVDSCKSDSSIMKSIARLIHQGSKSRAIGPGIESRIKKRWIQTSILDNLHDRIEKGSIHADPAQFRVAKRLGRLQEALDGYDNSPIHEFYRKKMEQAALRKKDSEAKAGGDEPHEEELQRPSVQIPRGLYIHGSVGSGKSMLMDTFYQLIETPKKRRMHFHAFLAEVHGRIHAMKQQDLKDFGRSFHVITDASRNPIHRVAMQLSSEISVLCFDEFQVTDVCDAVIMSQLFNVLFTMGTVVVATSNRPPVKLYEGGLNREYFLPFIDLLQRHCIALEIQSDRDYRTILSSNVESTFFTHEQASELHALVRELRGDRKVSEIELVVGFGRSITVQSDDQGIVGVFDFHDLCDRNLGAADYRAIAKHFDVIAIENIPTLNLDDHNRARRFITLIDELYEARASLVCTAVATPDNLFENTFVNVDTGETEDALGIDEAVSHGHAVSALASVRELSFAFRRAASRLKEMTSRTWWDRQLALKQSSFENGVE